MVSGCAKMDFAALADVAVRRLRAGPLLAEPQGGWEVDFVLRLDGKPKALQVTLTRLRSGDARALRAFGGGLVLTERGENDSVPLAAFLALV